MSENETTQPEAAQEPVVVELKLTVDQINLILNLLSELPFKSSAGLIGFIRNQTVTQLQSMQTPTTEEAPAPEVLQ